jgi:hypothetical protein
VRIWASDKIVTGIKSGVRETDFADKRQVSVALCKVDSIPDDKFIRYFEAGPIRFEIDFAAAGFVQ